MAATRALVLSHANEEQSRVRILAFPLALAATLLLTVTLYWAGFTPVRTVINTPHLWLQGQADLTVSNSGTAEGLNVVAPGGETVGWVPPAQQTTFTLAAGRYRLEPQCPTPLKSNGMAVQLGSGETTSVATAWCT